jgi:hypothetical protein
MECSAAKMQAQNLQGLNLGMELKRRIPNEVQQIPRDGEPQTAAGAASLLERLYTNALMAEGAKRRAKLKEMEQVGAGESCRQSPRMTARKPWLPRQPRS